MCTGSHFRHFLTQSSIVVRIATVVLLAHLGFSHLVNAQVRVGTFEDNFTNLSRIDSFSNVDIDTVSGIISLTSFADSLSEAESFRVVLSGDDTTFVMPPNVAVVRDIDQVPGEDEIYLITDSFNRKVFTYNAQTGRIVINDFANDLINPVDAHPFMENAVLKVLIADADGRVLKVASNNLNVEWQFTESLLLPSDAVVLPDRPEVLICDSGNNRIISVDTTMTGSAAIQWQFGNGEFNMPVDVEVAPNDSTLYLVTDANNHRVVLVRRDSTSSSIIWQFGTGSPGNSDSTLTFPSDADALPNGNILISDTGNNRLIEVTTQNQIVYRFAHNLFSLTDADRIAAGVNQDKTIVARKDSPRDTNVIPKRLEYYNEMFQSMPRDFRRSVDFDTLKWSGNLQDSTKIKLQLRTVSDLSDTTNAEWFGPTSTTDFYEDPIAVINPVHDGHRFYQFRAFLETTDRLQTPELLDVTVKSHFFRVDPAGSVVSVPIQDSSDVIITSWNRLSFRSNLSTIPGSSVEIQILDGETLDSLATFAAGQQEGNSFDIDGARVPSLLGRQSLRLRALLQTENQFVTPKLLSWRIEWTSIRFGPSRVLFTDRNFTSTNTYHFGGGTSDSVYVSLTDPNVLPVLDTVSVVVTTSTSDDSEQVDLAINDTRTAFNSPLGLPAVFAERARGNGILELVDRDTLLVTYVDPIDTLNASRDTSTATALVIARTMAAIQIENNNGAAIDTVNIGDSLFVRVTNERDQSLTPSSPDSIVVTVFDGRTNDSETLTLIELPDSLGNFNSGIFRNRAGLNIDGDASVVNDGRLYVLGGDVIVARYIDPDDGTQTEDAVFVFNEGVVIPFLSDAFDFIIAPNPYIAGQSTDLKLRAQVKSGEMLLRGVEIYNLAGDKVATFSEGEITFRSRAMISSFQGAVDTANWWDMQTDGGAPVASGTYFVKFLVRLTNSAQGVDGEASAIRKLVIVQ